MDRQHRFYGVVKSLLNQLKTHFILQPGVMGMGINTKGYKLRYGIHGCELDHTHIQFIQYHQATLDQLNSIPLLFHIC